MPGLESFPQNLSDNTFLRCGDDWHNISLISKIMSRAVEPHCFQEAHLYLHPESLHRLGKLSLSKRFRVNVKEFVLHDALLPKVTDEEAWRECVDVRALRRKDQEFQTMGSHTGAFLEYESKSKLLPSTEEEYN